MESGFGFVWVLGTTGFSFVRPSHVKFEKKIVTEFKPHRPRLDHLPIPVLIVDCCVSLRDWVIIVKRLLLGTNGLTW